MFHCPEACRSVVFYTRKRQQNQHYNQVLFLHLCLQHLCQQVSLLHNQLPSLLYNQFLIQRAFLLESVQHRDPLVSQHHVRHQNQLLSQQFSLLDNQLPNLQDNQLLSLQGNQPDNQRRDHHRNHHRHQVVFQHRNQLQLTRQGGKILWIRLTQT